MVINWPGVFEVLGGQVVVLLSWADMVPLEAAPTAGVKVSVTELASSPTPADWITLVIPPMVVWHVCGVAQPWPCMMA